MYICSRSGVYIKSGVIQSVQETKEEGEIMGLRFRKSIKIAPGVKLNLNKNSSSITVGTKGNHYTVNSKGKTTSTVSIPGTGLSYSTTSSSGNTKKTSKKAKVSTVKESSGKQSKPKKKGGCLTSCLVLFVVLILFFALIPSGDKKEDNKNPLGFDVDFSSSYRNDVTGRWRLARIAENKPIEEYVLDYYHNYFESDDEVHIIINFTLNTTNRILVFGNLLDVATMEYVDKEEHDAKIACSGMLLSEYHVNIDTGEIEKIGPQAMDDSPPPEVAEEHYEVDLSAGNYTAGVDIPVGTYNLVATGGSGNVTSSNMFSGGLNEIMGNPADEYSIDSFNGLKMDDGVVLTLGGTVTLHLVSENAKLAGLTARTATGAAPIDLGAGNYTCGSDFPPGTYNVVATGGNGNVNSDNMFNGGLNEIMGTTNDGLSIMQYNNAIFEDGNVLSISGTSVQLVPVGE